MEETDDGKPWGFIVDGAWRELPKPPMTMAGMGPPPFDVTLPSGEVRRIIHEPVHIDDINDPVLAKLAQEHEDSIGSGWKLGEPPDDGQPYETRIALAGARWYRPMTELISPPAG